MQSRSEKRSERTEQDGFRYMLMGFFQGPRIVPTQSYWSGVSNSISVITKHPSSFICLMGTALLKTTVDQKSRYREIYQKMPKRIDRGN